MGNYSGTREQLIKTYATHEKTLKSNFRFDLAKTLSCGDLPNRKLFFSALTGLFFGLALAGCGGGGGGSSQPASGLSVDKTSLSFIAEQGVLLPSQTIFGTIQGATAPVIVTIAYTSNGIVNASYSQLSTTSGQLVVTPMPSTGKVGTYNDTITVTACYDNVCAHPLPGSPKVIPVTTTIQPPAPPATLLVSEHGVAFASVPGQASLTRSLSVTDSSGFATMWAATSDQAWLRVTSSGVSGGALALTANPTGLSDGFYKARVTVSSSNTTLSAQSINVGLYVSSTASASTFAIAPALFSPIGWLPTSNYLVDPIRPLIYTASGNSIAIDHAYTGARIGTINVAGASYTRITIGDDGSRLFAINNLTGNLDVIDLDAQQVINSLPLPQPSDPSFGVGSGIQYARIHGKPVVILGAMLLGYYFTMPILDAVTGQLLGNAGVGSFSYRDIFVVSHDGNVLYQSSAGVSGGLSVSRVNLQTNSTGSIYGVFDGEAGGNHVVAGLSDLATNADGSSVYATWFTDNYVRTFSYSNGIFSETAAMTPFTRPPNYIGGNASADIEVDPLGHIVTGACASSLRIYSKDGVLARELLNLPNPSVICAINSMIGSLRITSDGLRIMGNGLMLNLTN